MGAARAIIFGVVSLGLCLAFAHTLRAQDAAASVTTTVDPCVPVDAEQFHRVLSIELGTSIEYGTDAPTQPGSTWVHVSCSERGIELRLEDGVTRKTMVRVLDPAPIEAASRTRLIALAVAEFVVASWVELRINDKPAVQPAGPPPNAAAREAAERAVRARAKLEGAEPVPAAAPPAPALWDLFGMFRLEGWSSELGLVPSFALRVGQRPAGHLAFSIGGDFGITRARVAQGQVQVGLGSVAGALFFVTTVGDVDLYAGAGGRFGFVRMHGLASDSRVHGEDFLAPYGGPLTLARLAYHVTQTFRLVAEAEAGLVSLPVVGLSGKNKVVALDGAWASIAVGIGSAF